MGRMGLLSSEEAEQLKRQFGLLVTPKSRRQAKAAVDARDCVEGLRCLVQVRSLLAAGQSSARIAVFIQEESKEAKGYSRGTLGRYLRLYRQYFISPMDVLRARAGGGETRPQATGGIAGKLMRLNEKREELEILEKAVGLQWERVQSGRETEKRMSGILMPAMNREFGVLKDMIGELVNLKADLGFTGYRRVPQRVEIGDDREAARAELLSPREKQALLEFGNMVMEMVSLARHDAIETGAQRVNGYDLARDEKEMEEE